MSDNSDLSLDLIAAKLEASPKDIDLWLLLAKRLDDPEKKKYCYNRVLSLDPENEFAQKCLQVLTNPLPNQTTFTICPLCGFPNSLSDIQCKRCHTSLDNLAKIRTVSHSVEISSISDLTVPSNSIDTPPKVSSDVEKGLSLVMQYQQRGDKYAARDVLRKILSKDNHNEQAWLLFSEVAEKPEHEIQCLKNVYKINPHNSQAIQRLKEIYRKENPVNRKIHEESIGSSVDIHPEMRLSGIKEFNEPSLNSDNENTQITPHPTSNEGSKNTGSSVHPAILPEEYKNPLLTTCKVCQKDVAVNAPTCPHCGVSLPGQRVLCPNCGSSNIEIINKGFSSGNAIAGAVLLGPLGLLGGLYGSKNSQYHCLSCQKTW